MRLRLHLRPASGYIVLVEAHKQIYLRFLKSRTPRRPNLRTCIPDMQHEYDGGFTSSTPVNSGGFEIVWNH